MSMDIMQVNRHYGITAIDDFVSAVSRIASKSNSGQFELASRFYMAKNSESFKLHVITLANENGEHYKDFVSWACDTYHMEKTAVYDLCKVGEHVKRMNYGTEETPDYYYYYEALYKSLCEEKWSIDETGMPVKEIIEPNDFDVRFTRDFAPSACQVLASVKDDTKLHVSGFDRVVTWIREGYIKPDMSVRALKQAIKDLTKPVRVETAQETAKKETAQETAQETAKKLLFVTIAINRESECIDRVTGTDNKVIKDAESLVKLSKMLTSYIQGLKK